MNNKDFNKRLELTYMGNGWIPYNETAKELAEQSTIGEVQSFMEITARDLSFHRCYFSILNYIYDYLPKKFQDKVSKKIFYIFIKHLKGNYDVLFEFKDGTKLVEYDSISFGNMSEKRFREYVRNQMPWIYENVIGQFYTGDIYDGIIETIENEYERFFDKLNK